MSQNILKILSVLPVLGHPRDSKRIAMLQQAGFDVEAVSFERDYHSGRLPGCPIERLGKIAHGRYLQRLLKFIISIPAMRRTIKRNHLVYASGSDMAFMALIAGLGLGKPVVLEIGDIRELQVAQGLKGRLVRILDKYLVDACSLLVATASGFVNNYYRNWLNSSIPAIVIENKLESCFAGEDNSKVNAMSIKGKPLVDRPLRIGYFGLLRCEWSWHVLKSLAIARPQDVEIDIAGYPMNPLDLPQQVIRYKNIKYHGEYRSPQDLPSLYNSVDMVWACYQYIGPNDWNLRWARPNRFYESCFFKKPIISRFGSCDSIEVDHYNIGLIVKDQDIEKVVEALCNIKFSDVEKWTINMSLLPHNVYMYTTETIELRNALIDISNNNI